MGLIKHSGYYENLFYNANHAHEDCELMYLISGRSSVTVGGISRSLEAGDCLLIKSGCHHDVRIEKELEYTRYIASVDPSELRKYIISPELYNMLTDTSSEKSLLIKAGNTLTEPFNRMTAALNEQKNIYCQLAAVLEILSAFYESIKTDITYESSAQRLSGAVREYIEQHYREDIRISDIAENNFVSESYLCHCFHDCIGISPRTYLTNIRCSKAYEMIIGTSINFSVISQITGFCSHADMSRRIKQQYGASPAVIRQQFHSDRQTQKNHL